MEVTGPSVFLGAMGTLSSWHVRSMVESASWHSDEAGEPNNRKLSMYWMSALTPLWRRIHSKASPSVLKLTGAEAKPNGS